MSTRVADAVADDSRSSKRARLTDDHCHLLDAVADVRSVISGFLPLADRIRLACTCTTLKLEGMQDLRLGASLGIPCSMRIPCPKLTYITDILSRCLVATELGDVRSYLNLQWDQESASTFAVSFSLAGRHPGLEWRWQWWSHGEEDRWIIFRDARMDDPHERGYRIVAYFPSHLLGTAIDCFVAAIKYLYLPRTDRLYLGTIEW